MGHAGNSEEVRQVCMQKLVMRNTLKPKMYVDHIGIDKHVVILYASTLYIVHTCGVAGSVLDQTVANYGRLITGLLYQLPNLFQSKLSI